LNVVYKKDKGHNKVGVLFIMTIWKVWNDFMLNKANFPSFLHVISLDMRTEKHARLVTKA
jgi:hypothetical protein